MTEYLEERAPIMEYDGGLPREQAEKQARRALRVYEYRLTDNPETWLAKIDPGSNLETATTYLHRRYGARLIEVREWKRQALADDSEIER